SSTSAQVSARTNPASTMAGPQLPPVLPTDVKPAGAPLRVCAGHRPATQDLDDRNCHPSFDTPTGYMRRPLTRVSAGQGHFQHVVAGEGFDPSKLSRWIYSPL